MLCRFAIRTGKSEAHSGGGFAKAESLAGKRQGGFAGGFGGYYLAKAAK